MRPSACSLLGLALFLGAASASAQTLYTINGPLGLVTEQTGPPGGGCAYPNGPFVSAFPTPAPWPCPVAMPFPPPAALQGDIAVSRFADRVYVTDGIVITIYTTAGVVLSSFRIAGTVPGMGLISGMGIDEPAGVIWITDGVAAAGVMAPPVPGCPFIPPLVAGPFGLPAAGAPYTDIDWDPSTGSLFVCGMPGLVANVLVGGFPGPFGIFPGGAPCALGPLTGLAVDHAALGGSGTLYLTDGTTISHILPPGVPAPPTFYSPAPCFPAVSPPISGLAFAAHGITYGTSVPATGPSINSNLQSISPNPLFSVSMTGATPGSFGLIYYQGTFNCPPIPFGTNLIYIGLIPPPTLLGSGIIPGSGTLTVPAPLPPFLPIPGRVFLEGFTVLGATIMNTQGLEIAFTRP